MMRNVAPCPGVLSSVARPPCRSASIRTMGSPRPLPTTCRAAGDAGLIRLTIARAGLDAVMAVTDDGPGILLEDQARIFERFYRSHVPSTRRVVGSGLGLPIVKTLAELHGGRVAVESVPGSGATFTFALPLATGIRLPEQSGEGGEA